jgi:gluconate 2-dehydrogenase gamma chain
MTLDRRNFLKITTLAIGGSVFAYSCKAERPGYYFFTEEEARCLIAICEQIIPADEDPGATDAGVIHYIDKQMVNYFKDLQDLYRNGLAAIQTSCLSEYNRGFEELNFSEQNSFLKKLEKSGFEGEEWEGLNQSGFFKMIIAHTRQGFYGSPRHGGNRDYMSYKMMGLEYPLVIGQNRY